MSLSLPPSAAPSQPQDAHEYLTSAAAQGPRGFAYSLTFETGVSYVFGLTGGGAVGVAGAMYKLAREPAQYTTRLKVNQILNAAGRVGGTTANGFAVFALTYSLTRDIVKFQFRGGVDDPLNEAIGAGVAGSMQALTRFPRVPALGCGAALGGVTYLSMKYGMDTIKKVFWPLTWL